MGAYVDDSLMRGEHVMHEARLHWIVMLYPCVILVAGTVLALSGWGLSDERLGALVSLCGGAVTLIGILGIILGWLRRISTELAVTNRRVIAKFGFISRRTHEISLRRIEGAHIDQGVIGRLLDFGTVFVKGTGGGASPITLVERPMAFRLAVAEAVETTGSREAA